MTFDEMAKNAVHVMDNFNPPKFIFNNCTGILLIKAQEAGLIISGTQGGGLVFRKTDAGTWSQPAAFKTQATAVGFTIGFAERDMIICLNRAATEKFMVDDFKINCSVDIGAALGNIGASADLSAGLSDKGGVAASMIYSHQKGAILNVNLAETSITNYQEANMQMYGTDIVKNILDGTAKPKDPAKVAELITKLEAYTGKE